MKESLFFRGNRPSPRRRFGAATLSMCGVLLLTGCEPDQPDTTITNNGATIPHIDPFKIERDTNVHVVRLQSSPDSVPELSESEIKDILDESERYMAYDLDNNIGDIAMASLTDVTQAPKSTEMRTGTPCYSINEIHQIRDSKMVTAVIPEDPTVNQVSLMVTNEYALCGDPVGKPEQKIDAAAFATGNFLFFSEDGKGRSYFTPSNFLHEFGHTGGLSHVEAIECDVGKEGEIYNPTDRALQDVKGIVSENAGCKIVRANDGSAYQYAARNTVMAKRGLDEFDFKTGIVPAYNSIDRHILLPDTYHIREIGIEPTLIRLKYGELVTTGVSITLTEDHPLRSIDPTISKLTVTVEVNGGSTNEDAKFVDSRECNVNAQCTLGIYASNDDYSTRVELPKPVHNFRSDDDGTSSVIYLDEKLGIGLLQHRYQVGEELALEVVTYEDGLQYAEQQKADRAALFKCLEETNNSSDC